MKKFKSIIITDFSEYNWRFCNNGGCYSFTEELIFDDKINKYERFYSTSADFEYCSIYGGFHSCSQCDMYDREEGGCFAKPKTVSLEDVEKIMQEHKENGSYIYEENDILYIEFGAEEEEDEE